MRDEFQALNAEYRRLADEYIATFNSEGKRLDEVHARRVAVAAKLRGDVPPPVKEQSESAKRSDRRRLQRAAERRRILEALEEDDARSDRTLAKLLKVDTRAVAKVRAERRAQREGVKCRCGCRTRFQPRNSRHVYVDDAHRDWHRRRGNRVARRENDAAY